MKQISIRSALFTTLIVSVSAAALVGLTAVLIGDFSDALGRALWTIVIAAIHSLLGITYVAARESQRDQQYKWLSDTMFGSLLVSFATAVFGIWSVLPGDVVGKVYLFIFIALVSVFHAEAVRFLAGRHKKIDKLIAVNYVFIAVVGIMLAGLVFYGSDALGDFYGRLLGAAAIVDATLTLIIIILDRMFAPKRIAAMTPGQAPVKKQSTAVKVIIVIAICYALLQFIGIFGAFLLPVFFGFD